MGDTRLFVLMDKGSSVDVDEGGLSRELSDWEGEGEVDRL